MVPPLLLRIARCFRRGESAITYEYIPEGWPYAERHPEVKGWNVWDVLEVQRGKWPRFASLLEGTSPLGIAHESDLSFNEDIGSHNVIMAFAYAITLAAHRLDTLSMLDWGGGIGHYYLLARAVLPDVEIDYHCRDVPLLADYGAQLLPGQHFYADESCLGRQYDFVMASTSLHYSEDWQRVLAGLAGATRGYLYITRLPTVRQASSFVFLQRAYDGGYDTEYLGWCLNQDEFRRQAEGRGLRLVREFAISRSEPIANAPEQCLYRGFLFRSRG